MRILHINKFLWVSGGVERYMFDVARLFEQHGHEIAYFAMADEARNRPSAQSKYFVSNLDFKSASPMSLLSKSAKVLGKAIYSFESQRNLRALLREVRPDVAHLHLIDHHISPSILPVLRDAGIPVVQSIHEYKRVCPNYRLYIPQEHALCERCLSGHYYHCAVHRCLKNSAPASALAAAAMAYHKAVGIYEKNVGLFLCSTQFLVDKLAQGHMPPEKLRHVPLTLDLDRYTSDRTPGDYGVFVGRLEREKGVHTLIEAMKAQRDRRLVVVGEGPERPALEALAREAGLGGVEFTGFQEGQALNDLIAGARFLVMPSEWYEPCGLAAWEAFAFGRPVIASRIGGIPEHVRHGETGLLFEPGNVEELAGQMQRLFEDEALCERLGANGREHVRTVCAGHYDALMGAYRDVGAV